MESFFSRFRNALVLIAVLLVQTFALATQVRRPADPSNPDGQHVRLLRLWMISLVSPFERASHGTGSGLRAAWSNYIALRGVRQQNAQLTRDLDRMRLERAALADDALEAERLRGLLKFQQHYLGSTVATQVIGTSGTDGSRVLTLDKGADAGLKPDMAVITPDGVVGKLRDVFSSTSQLLLLDDSSSGAGVLLSTTRIRAVVRGTPAGRLQIGNLTADARILPGERVVTSGGDGVFPRGLAVGTVQTIAPDPDHQPYTAITLAPAASLNRLDEVLVVTSSATSLDPRTQAELAADSAVHAADVDAARLPRLYEDAPQTSNGSNGSAADAAQAGVPKPDPARPGVIAAPPPENAPGLVPKPKPTLHPDRYSPGTTPPADQMTPGSPQRKPDPATPEQP